jgi:3-hydroxy acid dehydrogenase/malonic semialdehyde reductase
MKEAVAVITGASGEIGSAIACHLAKLQYSIVGVSRNDSALKSLEEKIKKLSKVKFYKLTSDLSNNLDIKTLFKKAGVPRNKIKCLINCTGQSNELQNFQDMNFEDIENLLNSNLLSTIRMTREVLPDLIKNKSGHIINIGSVAGKWSSPKNSIYNLSKAALLSFTESLRHDLQGSQIKVSIIEPGVVNTQFSKKRFSKKEMADHFFKGIKLLEPNDIAETVVWCLNRPPHVNIQELVLFSTQQSGVGHFNRSV